MPQGEELAGWLRENFRVTDIAQSDDPPEIRYWAGKVQIGDDFYLISSRLDSESMRWVKYLGNGMIVTDPEIDDGSFLVTYWAGLGCAEQVATVPFGNWSAFGFRDFSLKGDWSKKYGFAGFEKMHDPLIENFIPTMKRLISNDDAAAIAGMIRFPIMACLSDGKSYWVRIIENADEFKTNYHLIFNPEFKEMILQLEDDDFFCNYKGICVGRGIFWLGPGEDGILINVL